MKSRVCAQLTLIALTALVAAGCAQTPEPAPSPQIETSINTLAITDNGSILWNDAEITLEELKQLLAQTKELPKEPQLQFLPSIKAPYEESAKVLQVIKESGVTKFGFVGNEKYAPGAEPPRP